MNSTHLPPTHTAPTQDVQQQVATKRAAATFVITVLGVITLVCGGFLLSNQEIPDWFLIAGRWIPAIIAIIVILTFRLRGGIIHWTKIRPAGFWRTVLATLASMAALVATYLAIAALFSAVSPIALLPWPAISQALLLTVPMALVFVLSTIGEEAAWRGFLQTALERWGFWRMACTISGVWVLFHVPIHGTMALQGVMSPEIAISSTLGLFGFGIFLSAITYRFESVWPAAFAHAVPFSVLNLLESPDSLSPALLYGITFATAIALAAVGAAFTLRRRKPGTLERS